MYIINRSSASPSLGLKRVRDFFFCKENLIGKGGYARVYRQRGRAGIPLAVKVTRRDDSGLRKHGEALIKREAEVLMQLDHPNIVRV